MDQQQVLFLGMMAFVAFLIGLSKGGFGGAPAALATPLMALVMPPAQVVGLLLPVMMFADIFAVALHWRRWDRRLVWLLIPGSIVGVTIGTYFITNVPVDVFQLALGIIVLIFAAYKIFEKRILSLIQYRPHNWHGIVAGVIAGFSSALAHNGGPPVSIYLLLQAVTPGIFVATSALFFLILNWIKVPYYYYAGLFNFELFWQVAWLMPLVPLGVWVGRRFSERVDRRIFDNIILVLLVLSSLLLIFT